MRDLAVKDCQKRALYFASPKARKGTEKEMAGSPSGAAAATAVSCGEGNGGGGGLWVFFWGRMVSEAAREIAPFSPTSSSSFRHSQEEELHHQAQL